MQDHPKPNQYRRNTRPSETKPIPIFNNFRSKHCTSHPHCPCNSEIQFTTVSTRLQLNINNTWWIQIFWTIIPISIFMSTLCLWLWYAKSNYDFIKPRQTHINVLVKSSRLLCPWCVNDRWVPYIHLWKLSFWLFSLSSGSHCINNTAKI